jgi:hypothetical protein
VIRQGSLLSFAGMDKSGDLRLKVLRYDHGTSLYHLESTRGLVASAVESWILHSWIRSKAVIVSPPKP